MKFDAVLIAGPTASGKSAAALMLAEELGGVIVNADSMQVYRELRILTARPSDPDMARVPHALYGHVSVNERYSAGRYQREAAQAFADARKTGRIPIFTGGTGLYFGALTEGLAEIPPIPSHIREAAREKLTRDGVETFRAALAMRDAKSAAQILPTDTQRLLRAYEVFEATGRTLSDWQKESATPVLDGMNLARFVLDPPRALLHERIALRFGKMMEEGALDEAQSVRGLNPSLPAAKILGLRELWALADGAMTREQASDRIVIATRQYAKRQLTWFRNRMADWHWIAETDLRNIIAEINAHTQ
ncbi:MAG TPA: tRNA (adenosine(37)-N6)-dimethylallyltransferase MiaA [Rhizomicrobium sp.]|nr:tRNA (adenosine(37)-N6)-dimethylallyltransferase MiaA [Rhizomicrobium sp.]